MPEVRKYGRPSAAIALGKYTMPEDTLKAFGDHGKLNKPAIAALTNWREQLKDLERAGINIDELGEQLQSEGAKSFDKSWKDLMNAIATKSSALKVAL